MIPVLTVLVVPPYALKSSKAVLLDSNQETYMARSLFSLFHSLTTSYWHTPTSMCHGQHNTATGQINIKNTGLHVILTN